MKMSVCDVCKNRDKKIVESNKYWTLRGSNGLRARVDVCKEHENIVTIEKWTIDNYISKMFNREVK